GELTGAKVGPQADRGNSDKKAPRARKGGYTGSGVIHGDPCGFFHSHKQRDTKCPSAITECISPSMPLEIETPIVYGAYTNTRTRFGLALPAQPAGNHECCAARQSLDLEKQRLKYGRQLAPFGSLRDDTTDNEP